MTRRIRAFPVVLLFAVAACRPDPQASALDSIEDRTLEAHVHFLASDLLAGRAPGTSGSRIAASYIASQFEAAGLGPGVGDSSYLQPVPLAATVPQPTLSFRARGGARYEPTYPSEYVAWSERGAESTSVEAELVFVGYGISAPELGWDDYADIDVHDRVVLVLVNDPGEAEPARFRGDTLTYFGRWTYKLEEAERQGAAGAILIHTRESAGYGWNVVRSSWTGERVSLDQKTDDAGLGLNAWLSRATAEQVLAMAGLDFPTVLEAARSPGFGPLTTGVRVSATVSGRVRRFVDFNVAGLLRGSDPVLRDEVVIYTSHYDHLGVGTPVDSDSIYNGAYDNASGTAVLLAIAQAFTRMPRPPARSVLFLAVTAEEAGLLGSRYYAEHPRFPLQRTAANINFDGANLWGRTHDVVALGHELSTLEATVVEAARLEGLELTGDRAPEQGYLFRSDQFSFMRVGVPAVYIRHGLEYYGRPPGWGRELLEEYNERRYHQPGDEYREDFDYAGSAQQARVGFRVGWTVAESPNAPVWLSGARFLGTAVQGRGRVGPR